MTFQPKGGQIFEHYHGGQRIVICVTGAQTRRTRAYCVIKPDGRTSTRYEGLFENYLLIAEYPTWQEAVNSKEFKE